MSRLQLRYDPNDQDERRGFTGVRHIPANGKVTEAQYVAKRVCTRFHLYAKLGESS